MTTTDDPVLTCLRTVTGSYVVTTRRGDVFKGDGRIGETTAQAIERLRREGLDGFEYVCNPSIGHMPHA